MTFFSPLAFGPYFTVLTGVIHGSVLKAMLSSTGKIKQSPLINFSPLSYFSGPVTFCLFFVSGHTHECSGVSSGWTKGWPYGMPRTEPGLATRKALSAHYNLLVKKHSFLGEKYSMLLVKKKKKKPFCFVFTFSTNVSLTYLALAYFPLFPIQCFNCDSTGITSLL